MRKQPTLDDLKLKVAKHIVAQSDCYRTIDVWDILAETKIGAWRRQTLQQTLTKVFSVA